MLADPLGGPVCSAAQTGPLGPAVAPAVAPGAIREGRAVKDMKAGPPGPHTSGLGAEVWAAVTVATSPSNESWWRRVRPQAAEQAEAPLA